MNKDNIIFNSQFVLIAMISIITFKVLMLPSYLINYSSHNAYLCMFIMMSIELIMIVIVYKTITIANIQSINMIEPLKAILVLLVLVSSIFKLGTFIFEGADYVKEDVFVNANIVYILIPIFVCSSYVGMKGMKSIGRISEILIWLILCALVFNILFGKIKINGEYLKLNSTFSNMCIGMDKHFIWFADFTPFLFTKINDKKKNRALLIWGIITIFLIPTLITIVFIGSFSNSGSYIQNAFSKIAIFNQFSDIMGNFNILAIMAFLTCFIIKISLILFAIIECIKYFFFDKKYMQYIVLATVFLILVFGFKSKENSYRIATSFYRYVFGLLDYFIPMIFFIFAYRKRNILEEKARFVNEKNS